MIDVTKLSEDERALVLAKRKYFREWKQRNAEKVKSANDRFFAKYVEKDAASPDQQKEKTV